jgi:hypothetical protein
VLQHLPLALAEQPLVGQVERDVLDSVEPQVGGPRDALDLRLQRLGAQPFDDRVCGPQGVPDLLAWPVEPDQGPREPPPAVRLLPREPDLPVDLAGVPPQICLVVGGVAARGLGGD